MSISRREFVTKVAGMAVGASLCEALQQHANAAENTVHWSLLHPQYVFLNRTPGYNWDQNRPETITDSVFLEPVNAVGPLHSSTRRLGLSFILSYNNAKLANLEQTLEAIIAGSVKHDVPVLIVLDGENWWDGTPELWNWWDPSKPGYNPQNAVNVEWTDWGPEHAIKISWRNWGTQIRVLPQPNLGSQRFRQVCKPKLMSLAKILRQWGDGLPSDRQYLFPGVKIGWEASVGINAYYYPGGNSYLERYPNDSSHDPKEGMDMAKDFAGGLAPLGYAALTSLGWKHDGPVTLMDQERITRDYLEFLASCCHQVGLPRNRVFTHAGGQYQPWRLHYSHDVAINNESYPGWSLYFRSPENAGDLGGSLGKARLLDWCAAEWLPAANTAEEWRDAIDNTLGFLRCHFVSVYNWEGIRNKPEAVKGVGMAVAENAN